jgi:flagellar motility protein MotE (MotC chaperone)
VSRLPQPRPGFRGLSACLLATMLVLAAAGLGRFLTFPPDRPGDAPALREPARHDVVPPAEIEPEAGPSAAVPPAVQAPAPTTSPDAAPDAPTAAAIERLAAELGGYRTALEERERLLAAREAVVATLEARVAVQVERLKAATAELKRAAGEATAEERARIAQLVKVYEAMKAKNAAAIFDPMPLELLLPIMRGMRETKVAAIVAEMDPGKARALTAELARTGAAAAAP